VWVDRAQAGTRFALLLIGVFAGIAAVLAAVGLYGVLATFVRQRTAEIGVRMALGAAPSRIFSLVVGQGLWLSATGIGIGVIAAAVVTRVMASMLVGVKATDPTTFVAIVLFFFMIAAVACWIPAWRASSLDPTVALREE
jgi:putative ABC transport system permease protein